MAPSYFMKPETAHAKALDLINVGKKGSALDVLFEMLLYRRARSWQKSLEAPMFLFVDLCVELKRNQQFKRIAHHYRNISIQECPQSLDDVLKRYFSLIKEKTVEARKQSEDAVPDVEDLDVLETPESLMLNAVNTENAQGRSGHTILMPWLKFLWEAYRICLDLVRNNIKYEHVYHRIARDGRIQKAWRHAAPNGINLTNSETQIWHFETRLRQLDCSMELEMYNEAFKIVEDIWGLVLLAKKIDRPALMADYYSKTAELFLRSGYYLFHAAALYKRLALYREHKKAPSVEELSSLGSKALCAALSVPLPHARAQFSIFAGEYNQAKQKALASLLGLSTVPTRASLLADLSTGRVQTIVPPELATLYHALEVDFQPLKLVQRVQPALDRIAEDSTLNAYLEPLHDIVVSKTLLQLSQVYRSLRFDELVRICPFYDPLTLERCVIELIYNLELPMRVDHRRHAIIFDVYIDLGISQRDYSQCLQSVQTGGDQVSRQLTLFAQSLHQVAELLNVNESDSQARDIFVKEYMKTAEQHHRQLLSRRDHIESRKEQLEQIQEERARMIEEEEERLDKEKRARREQEEATLKVEAEERTRRHLEEQMQRRKLKIDRERLRTYINSAAAHNLSAAVVPEITEADLEQCSLESLVEKLHGDMYRRRTELLDRANARARKLDHFVRACRLQEIPLLREAAVAEAKERFEIFQRGQQEVEEASKREYEEMLKNNTRLSRMRGDIAKFEKSLRSLEQAKYKAKHAEWEALRARVLEERLAERRAAEEAARKLEEERREAEARAQAEAKRREAEREAAERRRQEEIAAALAEKREQERLERERQQQPAQELTWRRRVVVSKDLEPPALNAGSSQPIPSAPSFEQSRPRHSQVPSSNNYGRYQVSRGFRSRGEMGNNQASKIGWTRRTTAPPAEPRPVEKPTEGPKQQGSDDDGWQDVKRH
ncbi:Eukaryotic translation initiation factor 3 subunit A [Taenia crassiceps]|uniref:Eukaryotic translation initiation factor 3 subunit A n=1 Tax=Taenia crassiceps TaxID=6207 RepID=A0ABR4Q4X6_9CEST